MKLLSRGVNPATLVNIDLDQFSSDDDSSDDGGSDSSIDDGLPKHLEVIAATKVELKSNRSEKLFSTSHSFETDEKTNSSEENQQRYEKR